MANEKVIGIVMEKKDSEASVDIKIDNIRVRCWKTVPSGDGNRVPNPAIDELSAVNIGDGVEAEVFSQVKKNSFTGKDTTYRNLTSIAKRVDLEGAPPSKPAAKTYGKSPQERREILTMAVVNHYIDFFGRVLSGEQTPDQSPLAYWEENWERAAKLIKDASTDMIDFAVVLLGEQGIEK